LSALYGILSANGFADIDSNHASWNPAGDVDGSTKITTADLSALYGALSAVGFADITCPGPF
jgi:RsiW-degrading membrane proteinase PrsW (M82 family)